MGQPSLPRVTSRNQTAPSARPANFARRSTFQPATTGAGTFAGLWIAKIEAGLAGRVWPGTAPGDTKLPKGRRANESEQGQTVVCARPERSSLFAYCLARVLSNRLPTTVRLRSWTRLGFGFADQYDFCLALPALSMGELKAHREFSSSPLKRIYFLQTEDIGK
jgi:hypothetical protein